MFSNAKIRPIFFMKHKSICSNGQKLLPSTGRCRNHTSSIFASATMRVEDNCNFWTLMHVARNSEEISKNMYYVVKNASTTLW